MQQAINPQTMTELRSVMGDTLNEVVEVYLEITPGQIRDLDEAIRSKDADRVFNIAHKMKSSSSSIGATGLAAMAEKIELVAREGSINGTADMFRELELLYRDAENYLKNEFSS
jgi:HPt (histidine-containing phosphotransfer) domain-containing protein